MLQLYSVFGASWPNVNPLSLSINGQMSTLCHCQYVNPLSLSIIDQVRKCSVKLTKIHQNIFVITYICIINNYIQLIWDHLAWRCYMTWHDDVLWPGMTMFYDLEWRCFMTWNDNVLWPGMTMFYDLAWQCFMTPVGVFVWQSMTTAYLHNVMTS